VALKKQVLPRFCRPPPAVKDCMLNKIIYRPITVRNTALSLSSVESEITAANGDNSQTLFGLVWAPELDGVVRQSCLDDLVRMRYLQGLRNASGNFGSLPLSWPECLVGCF